MRSNNIPGHQANAVMAGREDLHGRLEGIRCHEQVGPPVPWTPEDRLFCIAIANLIVLTLERNERRRAGKALRESQERFRQLVENIREVFWLTDPGKTGWSTSVPLMSLYGAGRARASMSHRVPGSRPSIYAPFAAELRCLVESFQMKQLREWLKSLGETS